MCRPRTGRSNWAQRPDISIKPELSDLRTLHFYKVDKIYREAKKAKEQLKRELGEKLAAWSESL